MYAVILTGGKQHKIEQGTKLKVEKLEGKAGDSITFDKVLFVGTGAEPKIGTPYVDGSKPSTKN